MANPLIMVVDDEAAFADSIAKIIKATDRYDSVAVYSAKQALSSLEQNKPFFGWGGNRIKLILLDINMPDMDGLAFLEIVRKRFGQRIGVMMVTAWEDAEKWERATSGFVVGYIRKPIESAELIEKLNEFFSGKKADMILDTFEQHVKKMEDWKK